MNKSKKQRKTNKKRRSHKSNWARFVRWMVQHYGVFAIKDARGNFQIMLTYGPSQIPAVMPRPLGPAPGAQLTTRQYVNSFASTTGSAISGNVLTQSGTTATFASIAFEIGDLAQISSFSSLFDQYRVEKVHIRIKPYNEAVSLLGLLPQTLSARKCTLL